jgi:hypothetical protein
MVWNGVGGKEGEGRERGGHTFWVITMEQTMQARRLRCWLGGTKFSVMMKSV